MNIIPAIDIRGGNCVRLIQGQLEQETVYSKDPVFVAKLWRDKGASHLHLVDLDGAFSGLSKNFDVIKNIRESVDLDIEVGGGIRDLNTIEKYFEIGINKVILGTAAVSNSDLVKKAYAKFKDKILIAIDVKNDKAVISGWKETSNMSYKTLVDNMYSIGIREFIYTNINKDGMMEGPCFESINKFLSYKKDIRVIISGGISSINDIKSLLILKKNNLTGVIIGKALYTENIKLEEALELANHVTK
jgi:phosphoribosylformimino-5-aminoimidazole carboxamide ribotide isomerase